MRRDVRCGFTLLELMIVVVIIGILLALLMPTMQDVWAVADHYRCTTNLYYLSHAIAMRRSDLATSPRSDLRTRTWPSQLLPYLEQGPTVLMCPVTSVNETPVGGEGAGEGDWGSGADTGDWGAGSGDVPSTPPQQTQAYPPLTELAELRLSGGKAYQPLDVGPWTLKLSDEQFQAARAQGWLGADDSSHRYIRDHLDCTYHQGANPDLYYLCFEDNIDTGGDQDFQDTVIRVVDKHNGTYELTLSGHTGASHALVSKPDRQILLALPTGTYYQNQQITLGQEEPDSPGSSTPGSGPPGPNDYDPMFSSTSTVMVSTNYAMNGDNRYLTYRADKVAILDYSKYLFHCTDDWSEPAMDPNRDGIPFFARHWGKINVLMTDGSVQLMDPADLDPVRPQAYLRYWAP
jgi:prepilin-type N-terminal cleavage/methylation domain-containing protein